MADSTTKSIPKLRELWGWYCNDCGLSETGLAAREMALEGMEHHTEKRPGHDPRILVNLR